MKLLLQYNLFEKTVDHLLKILKRKSNLKTENIILAGGAQ